ncbi:hypothetical protein Tco_0854400 [Tanacetum coccineum]
MVDMVESKKENTLQRKKAKGKRINPMISHSENLHVKLSKESRNLEAFSVKEEIKVAEVKEEEPVKRTEKKKQKARKSCTQVGMQSTEQIGLELLRQSALSDLRTLFDPPLNEDCYFELNLAKDMEIPCHNDACQVMLNMKLLDGTMDEVCYKLLKMIEKQDGIRKR